MLIGADFFITDAVFDVDYYSYNGYYNYNKINSSQKNPQGDSNEKRKKEARHNGTDYYY